MRLQQLLIVYYIYLNLWLQKRISENFMVQTSSLIRLSSVKNHIHLGWHYPSSLRLLLWCHLTTAAAHSHPLTSRPSHLHNWYSWKANNGVWIGWRGPLSTTFQYFVFILNLIVLVINLLDYLCCILWAINWVIVLTIFEHVISFNNEFTLLVLFRLLICKNLNK